MECFISDYPSRFYSESMLELCWGEGHSDLYAHLGAHANIQIVQENIQKNFEISKRRVLRDVLLKQYAGISLSVKQKIFLEQLLLDHTFTVTTGQQIHVGLGPMYVWNKIMSVLNTAEVLKKNNPNAHYVPIFWMASEDHDFEEIRDVRLFNQQFQWKTEQTGPVGLFKTHELKKVFAEIREKINLNPGSLERLSVLEGVYSNAENLSAATRELVQLVFGETGLLVIDPNDAELKKLSHHIWKQDILVKGKNSSPDGIETLELMKLQHEKMREYGIEPQAYPREINCFYMDLGIRERIEVKNVGYYRVQTGTSYSIAEMEQLLYESPEKISPNVLLRPVYQQNILPNAVYVGGPAEIKYWIQIAPLFQQYGVVMPRLQLRLSSVILNYSLIKKINKLRLDVDFFWKSWEEIEQYIFHLQEDKFTLDAEIDRLSYTFETIWKSLYGIQYDGLKSIKKDHLEVIKQLKKISLEHKNDPESASQLAKELSIAKNIKQTYFNEDLPQERVLHWSEIFIFQGNVLEVVSNETPIQFMKMII